MRIEIHSYLQYIYPRGIYRVFKRIWGNFFLILAALTVFTSAFSPAPARIHETPTPQAAPAFRSIAQSNVLIQLQTIAYGLTVPRGLVSPPDGSGRLFVVGQTGLVNVIGSGGELLEDPFLNLRSRVFLPDESATSHGLLSLAFHPNFVDNGRFFVYYTAPKREGAPHGWDHTARVVEFSVSDINHNIADLSSERFILELDHPYPIVGSLRFDADGILQVRYGNNTRPTFCLDVDQLDVVQLKCAINEKPILNLDDIKNRLVISRSSQDFVPGHVYQGMAFPSFQDRYIFAVNGTISQQFSSKNQSNPGGNNIHLLITSELNADAQVTRIEELPIANWENGHNIETLHAIDRDTSGEIYILASHVGDQRSGRGVIYKIVPVLASERSIIENPEEYLPAPFRYARLVRQAPVYRSLADVRQNEPYGRHGGGNYWVTVRDQANVAGRTYYSVSWGWGNTAWVSSSFLNMNAHLSQLRGVDLRDWKGEALAMVYTGVNVRSLPGVLTDETIIGSLAPYSVVSVQETKRVNDAVWYRISPDQWVHSNYLRLLVPNSRPPDIGANEKWVEINLTEQTFVAYEGDRPVFVTLTATGRRGLETQKGLYRTWAILRHGPMQWENVSPAYSLANVPWIMYFNRGQGLHGVYWHDLYGTVRSAGCVNLSPHDSHWIFQWAIPDFPEGQRVFYPSADDPGLWVWVHDGRPDLRAQINAFQISQINWPSAIQLPEAEMLTGLGFIP
jgi:hypothetical protein